MSGLEIKDITDLSVDGLTVNGKNPEDGWVSIDKGQVIDYSLKFGDYVVNYDKESKTASSTKNGRKYCDNPIYEEMQTDASYFTFSNGTITGYTGTDTDVVIPCKINNTDVTEIGSGAFWDDELTSVIIPDTVLTIKDGAFVNNKLTSYEIPDSVITVSGGAFNNSPNLSMFKIGKSVSSFGSGNFDVDGSGTSVKKIIVSKNNPNIDTFNWMNISMGGTYNKESGYLDYSSGFSIKVEIK